MAYTRTKEIAGHEYKYVVKGKREGDSVKQKVVDYLGPVNPIYQTKKSEETKKSTHWFVAAKSKKQ